MGDSQWYPVTNRAKSSRRAATPAVMTHCLSGVCTRPAAGKGSGARMRLHHRSERIEWSERAAPWSHDGTVLRVYRLPHLDMGLGLVEQPQRGVPSAVWFQGDEGLEPLHTQAEVCSSAKRGNTGHKKQDCGLAIFFFRPFHNHVSSALIVTTKFKPDLAFFLQTIHSSSTSLSFFPYCDAKCNMQDVRESWLVCLCIFPLRLCAYMDPSGPRFVSR